MPFTGFTGSTGALYRYLTGLLQACKTATPIQFTGFTGFTAHPQGAGISLAPKFPPSQVGTPRPVPGPGVSLQIGSPIR